MITDQLALDGISGKWKDGKSPDMSAVYFTILTSLPISGLFISCSNKVHITIPIIAAGNYFATLPSLGKKWITAIVKNTYTKVIQVYPSLNFIYSRSLDAQFICNFTVLLVHFL